MTLTTEQRSAALLVVDVQRGVVDGAYRRDEVVSAIAGLVDRARAAAAPVIWVQHNDEELERGSEAWTIVPELAPGSDEPRVEKQYGDAFEATNLDEILRDLGVGSLVVAGAETDACIRSTIHGAFTRGYSVTLVTDAHTAGDKSAWGAPPVADVIAHTNLYWQFQQAPGRTAAVFAAAEIAFA